jgi:hypothetical protein
METNHRPALQEIVMFLEMVFLHPKLGFRCKKMAYISSVNEGEFFANL